MHVKSVVTDGLGRSYGHANFDPSAGVVVDMRGTSSRTIVRIPAEVALLNVDELNVSRMFDTTPQELVFRAIMNDEVAYSSVKYLATETRGTQETAECLREMFDNLEFGVNFAWASVVDNFLNDVRWVDLVEKLMEEENIEWKD